MNNVCSRAAICGNIFYIPYLMGAVQNRCIHWQEILREKISGITSTGLYFLSLTENFLGKKQLDFQAEILEENMSEEYQYLNLNPQQAVLLLNASPHYMTLQQTAQKLHDAVFKKYGEHCHFGNFRRN